MKSIILFHWNQPIYPINIIEFLVYFCLLRENLACQSFTTIEIVEHDARMFHYSTTGPQTGQWFPHTSTPFALNLTELLMTKLQLTESDLNVPVFFADVEQSRPFLIQQHPLLSERNESEAKRRWYKLTSSVPLDREHLCSTTHYPQRVSVANMCCAKKIDLPSDATVGTINNPCCIFLGITISSKGTYVLRVQILDVNDNVPKFGILNSGYNFPHPQSVYGKTVIGVKENTPIGSWIPVPEAVDIDEGLNGAVRYSIQSINDNVLWMNYFKLFTNVHAAGLPKNSSSAPFVLNNQKAGMTFGTMEYTGPGLLILQNLDREKFSSFAFNLVATDMGVTVMHSAFIHIRIVVLDENDNEPVFEKSTYQVELRENQAGVTLLHARVRDADTENNGRLTYHIQSSRLERNAGDVVTDAGPKISSDFLRSHIQLVPLVDGVTLRVSQPLDYEKQSEFNFDLIAMDHGQPALSATAQVHVNIINVNDHAPVIRFYYHGEPLDRDYARLNIFEQHGSGEMAVENKLICHVHVTDADSDFESIDCTVESTERIFLLREVRTNPLIQRSKIYELLSTRHLDREKQGRLLVMVRCQDGKSSAHLVSQNQLQLVLLDVNDHSPVFSQEHYHGIVPENAANSLVTITANDFSSATKFGPQSVQATDADTGANSLVFYNIIPWNTNASVIADHEIRNYTEDIINSLLKTQLEEITNTTTPSLPHAWDPVKDANQFYIDQTSGQIRTRVALNCEEQQVYHFLVSAVDQAEGSEHRFTATARVTVMIRDENDNPPVIEQRHYAFSVSEGLPRHTRVGQIHSTDADVRPDNRRTIYELKNVENFNASEFIQIEAYTGIILTRRVLDREIISQISFVVLARNEQPAHENFRGRQTVPTEKGPTFYDEASVTVTIVDENDNAPFMVRRTAAELDTKHEASPTVVDLTFRINTKEQTNPCIEFPFYFVDEDEGPNSEVDVSLEENSLFEFRLENTLLCKINNDIPKMNQINLVVSVQDKPLNKSKALKRQYTVRVHFVEEQTRPQSSIPIDRIQPALITSSATKISIGESTVTNASIKPRVSMVHTGRINEQTRETEEFQLSDPQRGKLFASSSTTVTIVAILVAVSGLLCLLLLGMVFALRKATPNARSLSSEYEPKPPEEDGNNSMLSSLRGDNQVYFTKRQSPASFQTANSSDRFKPIPQDFFEATCTMDQNTFKFPTRAEQTLLLGPNVNLLNNQVKPWIPNTHLMHNELIYTPGYTFPVRGLSTTPDTAPSEGKSDISDGQKIGTKSECVLLQSKMHFVQPGDTTSAAKVYRSNLLPGSENPSNLPHEINVFSSKGFMYDSKTFQNHSGLDRNKDNPEESKRESTVRFTKDDLELYQRCPNFSEVQTRKTLCDSSQVAQRAPTHSSYNDCPNSSSLQQSPSTKNLNTQSSFV